LLEVAHLSPQPKRTPASAPPLPAPDDRARKLAGIGPTSRPAVVVAVAVAIFAISLWQNLAHLDSSQFHPDESRWINRAHYLDDLLSPRSSVWEDRYLTRGQPPLGSYLIGLGLLIQGRDLETNGPWDFHYGNETTITWNVVKGNMPDGDDLVAARRLNAVVGALSCLVVFAIVTRLSNVMGGAAAGLFLAFHPLQVYLASIAVSDALFTLLVALAALTALNLARAPSWPRAILLGVVLGLGAATKLSPLGVAACLAALGAVILADAIVRRLPLVGRVWRAVSRVAAEPDRGLGWMLVSLPATAFATFVAVYPYLWPDPIGRTRLLLDFRRHEMDNQARIWPQTAITSRPEALQRTWHTLEDIYGTTGRAFEFVGSGLGRQWDGKGTDVPLAMLGLAVFVWYAWRRGLVSPHAITLALLGAQSAIILYGLRVDFNRYYLPLAFVCAAGVGMLAGQLGAWIAPLLSRQVLTRSWRPIWPAAPRRLQSVSRATFRRGLGDG
jgi:hypothetical protein